MKTTKIREIVERACRHRWEGAAEAMAEVETIETREALTLICCGNRKGECLRHGRLVDMDGMCEVGRGGPLVLPEPTAQRLPAKKRR